MQERVSEQMTPATSRGRRDTPDEAPDDQASRPAPIGMGAAIGIGAALGLVFGTMLDNLALGLAFGAGLGTVAGAVIESRSPPLTGSDPAELAPLGAPGGARLAAPRVYSGRPHLSDR